jgi:hypothetical protein
LQVQNTSSTWEGGGAYLGAIGGSYNNDFGGNIIIDNCVLTGAHSGIVFYGDWDATIDPSGFIIRNNSIYGNDGHGIHFAREIGVINIYNNSIYDNGPGDLSGNQGDSLFAGQDGASSSARVHHLNFYNNTLGDHPCKGWAVLEGCDDCEFYQKLLLA